MGQRLRGARKGDIPLQSRRPRGAQTGAGVLRGDISPPRPWSCDPRAHSPGVGERGPRHSGRPRGPPREGAKGGGGGAPIGKGVPGEPIRSESVSLGNTAEKRKKRR